MLLIQAGAKPRLQRPLFLSWTGLSWTGLCPCGSRRIPVRADGLFRFLAHRRMLTAVQDQPINTL